MGRIVHLERFVSLPEKKKRTGMENQADRQSYPGKQWIFHYKTGIEGGSLIRVENLSEKKENVLRHGYWTTDRRTVPPAGIS